MSINDGGPAYPCQPLERDGMPSAAMEPGLSIRDHFAGLAMQAHIGLDMYAKGEWMPHKVATHAYEMADAMLAERERGR